MNKQTTLFFLGFIGIVLLGVVLGVIFSPKKTSPSNLPVIREAVSLSTSFRSPISTPSAIVEAFTTTPQEKQQVIYTAIHEKNFEQEALAIGELFQFGTPSSRLIQNETDAFHWEGTGRSLTVSKTNELWTVGYQDIDGKDPNFISFSPTTIERATANILSISSPYTQQITQRDSLLFNKNALSDAPSSIKKYTSSLFVDNIPVYLQNQSQFSVDIVLDNNNRLRAFTGIIPPDTLIKTTITNLLPIASILENVKRNKGFFVDQESSVSYTDPQLKKFTLSSVSLGYFLDESKTQLVPTYIIKGRGISKENETADYTYLLSAVEK